MTMKSLAFGLLFGVCAWTPASAPVAQAPRVTVSVSNENWLDVNVYVMVGSARYRLGSVVTAETRVFDLPGQAIASSQVRLVADPVGSRDVFVSDVLSVSDGDQIMLRVANRLPQSSYAVERTVD